MAVQLPGDAQDTWLTPALWPRLRAARPGGTRCAFPQAPVAASAAGWVRCAAGAACAVVRAADTGPALAVPPMATAPATTAVAAAAPASLMIVNGVTLSA